MKVAQQAHKVVIAMRAMLVALFVRHHILAECLHALFTDKFDLRRSRKIFRSATYMHAESRHSEQSSHCLQHGAQMET